MPKLRFDPLLDVAALLVTDEGDSPAVELPEPGDDRAVVGARAVAVQLEPVLEDPRDVVERVRPVLVRGRARRSARSPRRSARPESARAASARRSSSPETLVPLSSGRLRSRLSRSRRRRSASPGIERRAVAAAPNVGAQLAALGTIASRWPKRRFDSARPKSSGSFSRVVCPARRGGRRRRSAPPGSATVMSPRHREAREHAARGRVGEDVDQREAARRAGPRPRRRSSAAASARGSPPASARRPSAVTETSGTRRSAACVAGARRTSRRRRCPSSRP